MELEQLRQEIDKADREILKAFCRRMDAVGEIAQIKKAKGLPVLDAAREEALLARIEEKAEGKYASCSRELFMALIAISREYQQRIINGEIQK